MGTWGVWRGKPMSRCYIIGQGTLPVPCAELLLARGHRLLGLISADAALQAWAAARGLPTFPPTTDLPRLLAREPCDYLFSIVNPLLLPPAVLDLPRRAAINYHDAPLPRYAGTHATSWALLHQEPAHGITWHRMTGQADAGAILQQRHFAIAPDETALTLNAKCYEAACRAFAALLDDLAAGRDTGQPQDRARRTFFPRFQRPPAAATLGFQRPAAALSALVRALDFGPYPNPLGRPKLAQIGRASSRESVKQCARPR